MYLEYVHPVQLVSLLITLEVRNTQFQNGHLGMVKALYCNTTLDNCYLGDSVVTLEHVRTGLYTVHCCPLIQLCHKSSGLMTDLYTPMYTIYNVTAVLIAQYKDSPSMKNGRHAGCTEVPIQQWRARDPDVHGIVQQYHRYMCRVILSGYRNVSGFRTRVKL
jgi:hypothetical protein